MAGWQINTRFHTAAARHRVAGSVRYLTSYEIRNDARQSWLVLGRSKKPYFSLSLPQQPAGLCSAFFSASASLPGVKSSTRRCNVECQLLLSSRVHSHSAHSICRTTKIGERNLDVMSELWSFFKFITRSDRLEMTVADLSHSSEKRFKLYNNLIIIQIQSIQHYKYT